VIAPPANGTVWVFCLPGLYHFDLAMRDGVVTCEYRDGRNPEEAGLTVEYLRANAHTYAEIPPGKETP